MPAVALAGPVARGGCMPPDFQSEDVGREQLLQRSIELLKEALRCVDELGDDYSAAAAKLAEVIELLRLESR